MDSTGLGKFHIWTCQNCLNLTLVKFTNIEMLNCNMLTFEISLTVRRNHNLYDLSHIAVPICFLTVYTLVSSLIWLHLSSFTINAN